LNGGITDQSLTGMGMTADGMIRWSSLTQVDVILGCGGMTCSNHMAIVSSSSTAILSIHMNHGINNRVSVGTDGATAQVINGNVNIIGESMMSGNCSGGIVVAASGQTSTSLLSPTTIDSLVTGHMSYTGICSITMSISSYDSLTITGTNVNTTTTIYASGTTILIDEISGPTSIILVSGSKVRTPRTSWPLVNRIKSTLLIDGSSTVGLNVYDIQFAGTGTSTITIHDNTQGTLNITVCVFIVYMHI
jgi:hypothetical protein